jgi:hypothetical protein
VAEKINKKGDMTCYFEEKLAIEAKWLIDEKIISDKTYKRYKVSGKINQLQLGGNGRKALIEYASLPDEYKKKVEAKIGDPRQTNKYRHFRSFLNPDHNAINFFANYKLQDGRFLPTETAKEYCTNAMFLNALGNTYNSTISFRRASRGRGIDLRHTKQKDIPHSFTGILAMIIVGRLTKQLKGLFFLSML